MGDIEWIKPRNRLGSIQNTGYELLQSGRVRGRLLGGCCGSLLQIMERKYLDKKLWKDSILFLDIGTPYGVEVATFIKSGPLPPQEYSDRPED